MNLPLILDVGIGLLFIYLTLSLLASELQELLTTVLQWRAKHLRQAIETLLAGEGKPEPGQHSAEVEAVQHQIERAKALTNNLYDHALLRSLNQEAQGILGRLGQIVSRITQTYRFFAGKSSGPSYVPSGTFSTTLMETLRVQDLIQRLSQMKLERFVNEHLLQPIRGIVADLRNGKADELLLEHDLQALQVTLRDIVHRFNHREQPFATSLNQAASATKRFLGAVEAVLPPDDPLNNIVLKRMNALKQGLPELLQESGPSIMEVVAEFDRMRWVAQLLERHQGDYWSVLANLPDENLRQRFQSAYQLFQSVGNAAGDGGEAYQTVLMKVSPYLQESLYTLARRAQARAQAKICDIEQDTVQFQQEIALWFDRSMDRATGVYKRNAKGVAILIGFLLAITSNTDTLHIVAKLSKDSTLRATYSQAASELVTTNPTVISCLEAGQSKAEQNRCLQDNEIGARAASLRQAIDRTASLPIGWSGANWREQWQPDRQNGMVNAAKLLAGWLISAIALAMGAPFWFNLLNKIVNVRNSGRTPAPVAQDQTVER